MAPMRTQTGEFTLCGDGLCVGFDSGDPVSRSYSASYAFSGGGKILGVAVDVSEDAYSTWKPRPWPCCPGSDCGSGSQTILGKLIRNPAKTMNPTMPTASSAHFARSALSRLDIAAKNRTAAKPMVSAV